ncbi:DUF3472 domain-containing protein [Fimbriimonas ginsengisoli]|uniref:Signal peptide protein n=1 Tax=Fimbriimonas ginsengisoli Gsoil 348 TaxID=661478 RepID=A0A068NMT3_FIMGI|nr:DUF3472 domain-containing protein [Fimbriimonas ginsengisoli]AIE84776.1 signal peptide protein [Fimbriimonas ginsengisoli Gsoil 348]
MPSVRSALALMLGLALLPVAQAQHLIWKPKPGGAKITALYGEIEVLETGDTIYYCGCNWWPGNPAGGYTGIQDPGGGRHNMIFSIWDTNEKLHPRVTEAEGRTVFSRFGGEGTGAHTHLDYDWKRGKTYRFYVTKEQDATKENTLTRLYFEDDRLRRWVHEATISNPNDGHESVTTFGGMLNAFLENWSGKEREKPKLALYRLWVGTSPSDLTPVTDGTGDGNWGTLNGSFYLAEGKDELLAPIFGRYSGWTRGGARGTILSVPSHGVERRVVRSLRRLPRSGSVKQ